MLAAGLAVALFASTAMAGEVRRLEAEPDDNAGVAAASREFVDEAASRWCAGCVLLARDDDYADALSGGPGAAGRPAAADRAGGGVLR